MFTIVAVHPHFAFQDVQFYFLAAILGIDAKGGAEIDDALVRGDHGEALAFFGRDFEISPTVVELECPVVEQHHFGWGFDNGADVVWELDLNDAVSEYDP